jgi:hypothetical protein
MPTQSENLEFADSLAITFEMQKNDVKHETAIHGRTDNSDLCHVLQSAHLVSRICTYPCASLALYNPVCRVWQYGCMEHITSQNILCDWPAAQLEVLVSASSLVR